MRTANLDVVAVSALRVLDSGLMFGRSLRAVPFVAANGIRIAYESWGEGSNPAVLLLPGAGRQLIEWDPAFLEAIAAGGYRVIIMDQRDTGLSTHFEAAGKANLAALRTGSTSSQTSDSARRDLPYTLEDMAGDAVGVIDDLSAAPAHVVGFSLGGAVAQGVAAAAPDRVRSLTSVMASTGEPGVGRPDPSGARIIFRSPPARRDSAIEADVEARRLGGTPGSFDEARVRRVAAAAHDRAFDPAGTGRQLAALWSAGDRTDMLARIASPTLVIHGSADRLVHVSGGIATARAIPGARLAIIEGMGHDLPEAHRLEVVTHMLEHFAAADTA